MSTPQPKLIKGAHFCQPGLKKHISFYKMVTDKLKAKRSVITVQESTKRF